MECWGYTNKAHLRGLIRRIYINGITTTCAIATNVKAVVTTLSAIATNIQPVVMTLSAIATKIKAFITNVEAVVTTRSAIATPFNFDVDTDNLVHLSGMSAISLGFQSEVGKGTVLR
ncbi:MAG: hypothetical protein KME38_06280 [Spirirestis rafaelensis WJT71-NPBG6]|jgi:hypothetical protein|nr:hypothetical protein [Spirirestis rafaelensis WJT71-NPBG6]